METWKAVKCGLRQDFVNDKVSMEQHALKSLNNCLNTNIYSYIETSGACIIKLIAAVVYSFHNKLCLSIKTKLGWKGLPGTNTPTYYRNCKLRLQ
jgi:hypothetical protein